MRGLPRTLSVAGDQLDYLTIAGKVEEFPFGVKQLDSNWLICLIVSQLLSYFR